MKHLGGQAVVSGYEALAAWSDLLDRINVFPVADADTGTNLRLSLAPLRHFDRDPQKVFHLLPRTATGNSGNIAASFFLEFLRSETNETLLAAASRGRDRARAGLLTPRDGTMLNVFDRLAEAIKAQDDATFTPAGAAGLVEQLQQAVEATTDRLPELNRAGVVDAGALGMFIFLDIYFQVLSGHKAPGCKVTDLFKGRLAVAPSYRSKGFDACCVDALVSLDGTGEEPGPLTDLGDSVVMIRERAALKIHLHTRQPETVRARLETWGRVERFSGTDMADGPAASSTEPRPEPILTVMTDAAGSVNRSLAARHGMVLLDSYIRVGDDSRPETLCDAAEIYALMRQGVKVSTAQASDFERHQHYAQALARFSSVLYLCVGAAFTGNYHTALAWKKDNDPDARLLLLDSEAASGRLGLMALHCARQAETTTDAAAVFRSAEWAVKSCEEYVFIDQLKYLVAGGRLSRPGGFFGDLLHMKPVVSPRREGARKVGLVRNRTAQLEFALARLRQQHDRDARLLILLQYTDNRDWVGEVAATKVAAAFPAAEILVEPISLTAGVHMGPGTWALAFLPAEAPQEAGTTGRRR